MIFGVSLPNYKNLGHRQAVLAISGAAEDLGYTSVWTSDHIVLPTDLFHPDEDHFDPVGNILESFTTLAFLAACTSRVLLGTSVLVLPQRNLHLAAKQAATVHHLSGERLVLGLGVGWLRREFDLLGAEYSNRGAVTDECVDALRVLFESDRPAFHGSNLDFDRVHFSPRPATPIPLLVGGNSVGAVRRAAERGDGWHAVGLEPQDIAAGMLRMKGIATKPRFEVSVRLRTRLQPTPPAGGNDVGARLDGTPEAVISKLRRYEDAGVHHMVIDLGTQDLATYIDQLRRFAQEVMPAFTIEA